jgi:hypothetical protein
MSHVLIMGWINMTQDRKEFWGTLNIVMYNFFPAKEDKVTYCLR